MFVALPIGHDQPVYTPPYVTYGLMALNIVVFVWTEVTRADLADQFQAQAMLIEQTIADYPDSLISPDVGDSLPHALSDTFAPRIADDEADPDIDPDLDDAVAGLAGAFTALPGYRWGYRPAEPRAVSLVTTLFLHGGIFHLLGNLLFLFLAGSVIECFWRAGPYLGFYLLGGVGATVAHHLANASSEVPLIGASGAIAALMGAFVVAHHRTRIRIFYFVWIYVMRPSMGTFNVAAWVAIPAWIGLQILQAVGGVQDGVAYWAHAGGAVLGVLAAIVARQLGLVAVDGGEIALDSDRAAPPRSRVTSARDGRSR